MHVRRTLARAGQDVRKDPGFWVATGFAQILLIWSQDLIPFAGTILASILSVWLFARLIELGWRKKAGRLAWVGLLHFPLTAAWPILLSFHLNAGWFEPFSIAWTLPMLFILCIGEITLARTVREILRGAGVDRSLAAAWKDVSKRFREVVLLAAIGCAVFTLCLMTHGAGFLVAVPFALATLREF